MAFISRLISESVVLQTRVQWYTTMLGKLSSVGTVVERIKEAGVKNWAVAEFVQGKKTRRWGVAWSFGGRRPEMRSARAIPALPKGLLPFPSEVVIALLGAGKDGVGGRVDATMKGLDLRWRWRGEVETGVGFAGGDVWSRAARRGRGKKKDASVGKHNGGGGAAEDDEQDEDDEEEEEAALGFKIQIIGSEGNAEERVEVLVRWLQGHESVLWESFCGMLRRRLLVAA